MIDEIIPADRFWSPRQDSEMALALLDLEDRTGKQYSEIRKHKTIRKFGRTANADNGVSTTVGTYQGAVANEDFATSNSIDSIVSDSASDTGPVDIEGHYEDADGNFIFHAQTITLTGTTPALLSRTLIRASRIRRTGGTIASPAVPLVGNVYVYDSAQATGVTLGVPDVDEATKCMVVAGRQQSQECNTAISAIDALFLDGVYISANRSNVNTTSIDFEVESRTRGGVWLPIGLEATLRLSVQSQYFIKFKALEIIHPNTDVRLICESSQDDTEVGGFISGRFVTEVTG